MWRAEPAATATRLSEGQWRRAPHLDLLSAELAAIAARPLRLIINMPPRHGKSELVAHWLPVWAIANWPNVRIGLASYEATFAAHWGRRVRDTVADTVAAIRPDVSAAAGWETTGGASMHTAGIDGPFTGRGFDLIIIDDPVKNAVEARSAVRRQRVWDWWRSTVRTRAEPGASIIVVMTRWHHDDFAGRLLDPDIEGSGEWRLIRLPAFADEDDALGRAPDAPLWPERFDTHALTLTRTAIGPEQWAGMYQQRPSVEGGQIFRSHWWRYADPPTAPRRVYQYWDTAYKTGQENDYTACVTVGETDDGYHVLDVYRDRLEYPDMLRAMQAQAARWRPAAIYIEDKASGQSAAQSLRVSTRLPIIPVAVDRDKVSRANRVTGTVEAGRVYLPLAARWLPGFLDELHAFPHAVHDDQVDAFVGALSQFVDRPPARGIYV